MSSSLSLPVARRDSQIDVLHGVEVADPYRWLEDEQAAEVQAWTRAQDDATRAYLLGLPERSFFRRRLGQLLNVGGVSAPSEHGSRVFLTRHRPGQNQPTIQLLSGRRERIVLDPNPLSQDGTVALDWWYPSRDGALLAYGLSSAGDEQSTLRVRDVVRRADLPDRIERARAASVAWLTDGSGFYYTAYPAPGTVPPGEEHYHRRVFLHRLGDAASLDRLIYAPERPEAWPSVSLSPDGRYLLIVVSHGWTSSDLLLLDHAEAAPTPRVVIVGQDADYDAEVVDGVLYVRTNEGAPNYRMFAAAADAPARANWREIVPESDVARGGFAIAAGHLVLHELVNATSRLALHALDGRALGKVPLPGVGTVVGLSGEPHGGRLYFGFTSFDTPASAYAYSPGDQQATLLAAPRLPGWLASTRPKVEQVRYRSRDGTPVSMFVLSRPDTPRDGERPTLLTGYGGFNLSRTPSFAPGALAWIERGGVWALPNLRGGGEYGEAWHRDGMLGRKQNVFDDFIAAAEWLIAEGYTQPRRLAISGGSNGGLLVGAALTQRPDLFQAVACAVPLLDMLRYHRFRIARLWISEYGSADDPEQFAWLRAYSPYHRVSGDVAYPAVLLTTGEQDSRVDPMHARKMAAMLQAASTSGRPILLRVEQRAGHGAGKPLAKLVEEQADVLAFLSHEVGSP